MTRLSGHVKRVKFLGSDYTHKNPDVLIDGTYADIKSPRKLSKLGKHFMDAKRQCNARGQVDGHVILSNLFYEEDFNEALALAREFVDGGTLKEAHIVGVGFETWSMK